MNKNALLLLLALVGIIFFIASTSPLSIAGASLAPSNPLVLVAIVGLFAFLIYRGRKR